jgi:phosphoribosylaminoimidazole-succinocarboxamide synthase
VTQTDPGSWQAALAARPVAPAVEECILPELGPATRGKVRESYLHRGQRVLITSDRVSAFDVVLGTIPFKGQVLNRLSAWWFQQTRGIAPNHLVAVPDANVTIARDCRPFSVELVVRGYLTGVTSTSIWTAYAQGEREFGGVTLPSGMRKNEPLPRPLLTPTTKAEHGGHDRPIRREDIVAQGRMAAAELDEAEALVLRVFTEGQRLAAERGLLLVDTKYELGRPLDDPSGPLVLIDELHTPDSSRYWYADGYAERLAAGQEPNSFDKEYLRRWLAEERGYRGEGPPPRLSDDVRVEMARRYITLFEQVTGTPFVGATGGGSPSPVERIRHNLRSWYDR